MVAPRDMKNLDIPAVEIEKNCCIEVARCRWGKRGLWWREERPRRGPFAHARLREHGRRAAVRTMVFFLAIMNVLKVSTGILGIIPEV